MATSSSSSSTAAPASRRVAKVAVVGAGAAGLAAAKELREFGHDVRVFEKGRDVGGVWVYDAAVEDDALGVDPNRAIVHSSVYASLRTNLPREVMGYASFPFASSKSFSGSDDRRFCGHEEVRAYLRAYATRHDLLDAISLGEEVTDATPVVAEASDDDDATRWGPKWRVTTRSVEKGDDDDANAAVVETFDALVVCNGHYSVPRVPSLPGSEARPPHTDWSPYDRVRVVNAVPEVLRPSLLSTHRVTLSIRTRRLSTPSDAFQLHHDVGPQMWPGTQTHSHNYRTPEGFEGKTVVVLGAMASGEDLAREIATRAKTVHLAARGWTPPREEGPEDGDPGDFPASSYPRNCVLRPGIAELRSEGVAVVFEDGAIVEGVDAVVYATGYHYVFPFLEGETDREGGGESEKKEAFSVAAVDNCVSPLYKHVFPPRSAPSLSFIGLPWKVVPFPQFELQARWIAKTLAEGGLPSREAMAEEAAAFEESLARDGVARRHAHRMGETQFAYNDELSTLCGEEPLAGWRAEMYRATGRRKRSKPTEYRDAAPWDDEAAREAAREEFARFID